MNELIENEAVTEPIEETIATDEQEATGNAPEAEEADESTTEEETQQKPDKCAPPSMEERMLEMLLRESHPDTLKTALENGNTIRGAWEYVVSVIRSGIMNTNQLTGTIAVYDDAVLNARFSYAVNTSNNKVTYTITCYWKKRNIRGECPFKKYDEASIYFDGLPAVSKMEMV